MKKLIKLKNDREILLLGTAHVSKESVKEVEEVLSEYQPECVCVELDEARYSSMKSANKNWLDQDLISIIKKGKLLFLFVQIILSSFQKRIAEKNGVQVGDEMRRAISWTEEKEGIKLSLIDRDVNVTLKRAWRGSTFWQKLKILSQILFISFEKEEITEESIEKLKEESALSLLMKDISQNLPSIKRVLVDERDTYLACSLLLQPYRRIVAVVGAGHVKGIESYLLKENSEESSGKTLELLNEIPFKGVFSRFIPWLVTLIVIGFLGWIFYKQGAEVGLKGLKGWILTHSGLSLIAAILAMSHPITWVVAVIVSPFTSLVPVMGVGLFTALSEAYFRKPKVRDFLNLPNDLTSFKGFFSNRISHIMIVFFATSLGSFLGTLWGIAILTKLGIN